MKFHLTLIVLTGLSLAGCSSTFLASKDGKGYYLGSSSDAARRMFCESGDLKSVLADTRLPGEISIPLYDAACGDVRSPAKVRELYAQMTGEQRKDLRQAFKRRGYDINYIPC